MRCPALIYDVTQICATSFPKAGASRLIRYLNAAHVAGYVGLSRTYSKRDFFDKLNEKYQFLNKQEMTRIEKLDMDHGSDAFHELVSWCMIDIESAYRQNHIDAREKSALKEKTTQFRAAMDCLYDYNDQPIHFFYIHFLCLLSAVYLPLFAVDNAFNAGTVNNVHWTWDVLSGMIVLVQAIFVIGLRLLGQKMSDPFGDDLEDLSVMHYVTEAWRKSNQILATHRPVADPTPDAEEALKQKRTVSLKPEFEEPAAS
jgi:predicted membrane chloride channel (bestrophin family)